MNAALKYLEDGRAALARRHPIFARLDALIRARFAKFLMIGALNTFFGYAVFLLALWLTGRSLLSLAISWTIGVLFNFCTTGRFVFGSSDRSRLARFIAVYVLIFCINALALRALEWLGLSSALAALLLTPFMAALSYLFTRDFVFSSRNAEMGSKGRAV